MSEMHYDHDQSERDYYDRQNEKSLKGRLTSAKIFAIGSILVMLWMIFSCDSLQSIKEPPVSEAFGTVVSVKGDQVFVAFEVINKDEGSQVFNWFYCPRHNFRKGNTYPDPDKYKPAEKGGKDGS